ncbi:uncharacterized protein KY384_004874 [Bacidia gigantensis]|uniref:uncharacterized protein n=1 Tax=Bacidia gigantensis TaxID=2732470 RepID=UPI001D03F5E1|nr:uncharacterized protein KY384_004874 [Bacidia gigantensis]KAG8530372.1 hypothetical protein KY384_004874 [Bacidia gigantensis]
MSTVNRPTNVKQKEADVNQKLQLYGIYSGFANGKVPSNKQVDIALNSALASKPLATPSSKLSEEGRLLVADVRDVIEQAKVLLLTKNQGNLLQDFIWTTQHLGTGDAKIPGAPVDKSTAQQHGNEALEGLRTLGTLLLSNGQFRKLLQDATILVRDIAGDAASNAASRIKPGEDQLNQIDHPAEENTWHDVPDLSAGSLKTQAKDQYNKNKPFNKADAQNATNNAATTADQQQDAGAGAQTAVGNLTNTASQNIPQEQKDKAKEFQSRTKGYLGDKLPKERREQTIYRLKKMVVEIQSHSDYQQAVETLLTLAEQYGGHGKNVASQGSGTVKGLVGTNEGALTSIKTLLERFANSTSADDLFDSIKNVYDDAEKDPELKNWFKALDYYIRKCLKESGFIMKPEANDDWNELYDKGQFLLRERYRNHTDHVLDQFKFFGRQFDEDPMNKKFALSVEKLFKDLGNDQNGKPTFKTHLVKDLSEVVVPGILESVRYVPVPRIEYSDSQFDAIIENLVIESDNLAPNSFEFGSDNYFRWGRKTVTNKNKNKVMVSVSGVQMDLKDVSYYIKRKQGFPAIKDTGVMDIFMGGSGFSFKIAMETTDKAVGKSDKTHFFKINSVSVDIKSLTIKLKQSKHKLLFNVFRPLMFAILRPAVGKVLEKLIKDQVTTLDGKAFEIHQEAERAAKAVQNDPENAPNIYKRYSDAAQKVVTSKKAKAEETAADKKANVAMTQNDSIFPQIKLPGGISTKATEYKALAAKGEKWESPVFGIGSASESTGLPSLTAVSRKAHSTSTPGVRGPQNTQSNNTSGFSSEVNQAFNSTNANDLALKGSAAPNGTVNQSTVA